MKHRELQDETGCVRTAHQGGTAGANSTVSSSRPAEAKALRGSDQGTLMWSDRYLVLSCICKSWPRITNHVIADILDTGHMPIMHAVIGKQSCQSVETHRLRAYRRYTPASSSSIPSPPVASSGVATPALGSPGPVKHM